MGQLAIRFPHTKFLKAISTTCIPNFPEKNLPSIFIYFEGIIKKQIIGPVELRGEKLTADGKYWWIQFLLSSTVDLNEFFFLNKF